MAIIVPEIETMSLADTPLTIDAETRLINTSGEFLLGVEMDNDSERVRFQCPKVVGDDVDLSNHHIYIHYMNAGNEKGKYLCEDVEDIGENITFSWLLSDKAVRFKGETKFLVCAKKGEEDPIVWHTTLATGKVLEGLDIDDEIIQQNDDVIEQMLVRIEALEKGGGTGITGVEVTVDENTGTPSATGSVEGGVLKIDFKNLKGATPNLKIGEVTTLQPDQQATASITGTPENPLLNLGIPQGQAGGREQYELVGVTPIQIEDGSWFIKPEVETVISNSESFSEGEIKNIAEEASDIEQASSATKLEYEQNKNTVELSLFSASSPILPLYFIYFPTSVGKKYTFFVKTDSGKQSNFVYGNLFPANSTSDKTNNNTTKRYLLVDSGNGFTFSATNSYVGFGYCYFNDIEPHINTYYLFEGEYESIPEGGASITLTVQASEKRTLSAFSGSTLYANPETNVYKLKEQSETRKEVIICFGDSIMQLCKIPEYISETYDMEMYNLGVSGATISYRGESSTGNNAYDFVNIVDSLESNDLSSQISKGLNENFETLLGLISKATVLLVEYGTNDFQGMVSLNGEETNTIEGAYKYCLKKLSLLYPFKKIFVISTLGYTSAGENNGSYDIFQLKEKVKDVCDKLHFPFIDMMTLSNITESNKSIFLEDGVHPKTENGRKRYGDALYYALKTYGVL